MTDPLILRMATDSADAAQFVAAMAAGDSWEWQTILDGIADVEHAKRVLAAMSGLYLGHVHSSAENNKSGHRATWWPFSHLRAAKCSAIRFVLTT
jgi:hypothetical protein